MINVKPPRNQAAVYVWGRGADDLFLLECRWCDKSPTLVAVLRAAWPVFAETPQKTRLSEKTHAEKILYEKHSYAWTLCEGNVLTLKWCLRLCMWALNTHCIKMPPVFFHCLEMFWQMLKWKAVDILFHKFKYFLGPLCVRKWSGSFNHRVSGSSLPPLLFTRLSVRR